MSKTQVDMVYEMLVEAKEHGVTPMEALAEIGCLRLAARIRELRNEDIEIVTKHYKVASGKYVAKYVLARYAFPSLANLDSLMAGVPV